nr:pollen-specific leucine-rich repeat extensin-like protein 1 [Arachis hypogaea]
MPIATALTLISHSPLSSPLQVHSAPASIHPRRPRVPPTATHSSRDHHRPSPPPCRRTSPSPPPHSPPTTIHSGRDHHRPSPPLRRRKSPSPPPHSPPTTIHNSRDHHQPSPPPCRRTSPSPPPHSPPTTIHSSREHHRPSLPPHSPLLAASEVLLVACCFIIFMIAVFDFEYVLLLMLAAS